MGWENRLKKIAFAVVAAITLGGCASSGPYPVIIADEYYMVGGDQSCAKYQKHADFKRIRCWDLKGKITGEREAMTPEQMQMYQMEQQAAAAQAQANAARASQVYIPNYQVQPVVYQPMVIPQPSNYNQPRNQMNCISTGLYMNCR